MTYRPIKSDANFPKPINRKCNIKKCILNE